MPHSAVRATSTRKPKSPLAIDGPSTGASPYHFSLLTDGRDRGSHGSTFELGIPIVLSGVGARTRRFGLRRPGLVDVAPTIAALLGAEPPAQAQGRSLVL